MEGTRHGDLVAVAIYASSVVSLMPMILEITRKKANSDAKMADDFSAAGSIWILKYWLNALCK